MNYDLRFTISKSSRTATVLLLLLSAFRFPLSALGTPVMFPLSPMIGPGAYTKSFQVEAVRPLITDGTNEFVGSFKTITPTGGTNPIVKLTPNDYLVTFQDARTPWRISVPNTNTVQNALELTNTNTPLPMFVYVPPGGGGGALTTNFPTIFVTNVATFGSFASDGGIITSDGAGGLTAGWKVITYQLYCDVLYGKNDSSVYLHDNDGTSVQIGDVSGSHLGAVLTLDTTLYGGSGNSGTSSFFGNLTINGALKDASGTPYPPAVALLTNNPVGGLLFGNGDPGWKNAMFTNSYNGGGLAFGIGTISGYGGIVGGNFGGMTNGYMDAAWGYAGGDMGSSSNTWVESFNGYANADANLAQNSSLYAGPGGVGAADIYRAQNVNLSVAAGVLCAEELNHSNVTVNAYRSLVVVDNMDNSTNTINDSVGIMSPGGFIGFNTNGFFNNGVYFYLGVKTNSTPSLVIAPNGSLCTTTNGQFFVRSNATWVLK